MHFDTYRGIYCSTGKKEQTTDRCNNIDASPRTYAKEGN